MQRRLLKPVAERDCSAWWDPWTCRREDCSVGPATALPAKSAARTDWELASVRHSQLALAEYLWRMQRLIYWIIWRPSGGIQWQEHWAESGKAWALFLALPTILCDLWWLSFSRYKLDKNPTVVSRKFWDSSVKIVYYYCGILVITSELTAGILFWFWIFHLY